MARFRRFTVASIVAASFGAVFAFQGCGDSSSDNNIVDPGADASSQGGTSSGGTDSGGTSSTSGGSGGTSSTSGGSGGAVNCKASGDTCGAPTECCTNVCNDGTCGETQCVSDSAACTNNEECCGGRCTDGTCQPLNTGCKTAGNECAGHGDCCSRFCNNGYCSGRPSYCAQLGDACAADGECCTGICSLQSGVTLGTCIEPSTSGTTGCLGAGQVCGDGATGTPIDGIPECGGECCSRSCAPYGPTGVFICQPPSGCRPTGELCINDTDCCGGPGLPGNESVTCSKADGEPVGRCDNGNACRGAGAVCKLATGSCNAENNCCAGNVNQDPSVCQQDLLGIPRCTGAGDCTDGVSRAGQACASSADCCGLPCLPNLEAAAGDPPFICGPSCVDADGTCTTDGDCCAPLPCVLAPGSTRGTCTPGDVPDGGTPMDSGIPECALYGQECSEDGDCCNMVPCSSLGRCQYTIR